MRFDIAAVTALGSVLGCIDSASAAGTVSSCCTALAGAGFEKRIHYPGHDVYEDRISSYWSVAARVRPQCLFQPLDTAEVSKVVQTFANAKCKFAIRSGGHTTWPGAASIEDGVTIDLGLMNSTTYHPGNATAAIRPGARWASVYGTLDKLNVSVAGGRAGSVGVGGFTLGGGNSFWAARKGFVCDNVANFEVVLGSGEVVNANAKENADLFQALKGGSNNFGVVTRFDMFTFPAEKLWGGVVVYPWSTSKQQMKALSGFTTGLKKDPYGSAIVILHRTPAGEKMIINAYEHTGGVAAAPIFTEFLATEGEIMNTMRVTNITDLTTELEQAEGYRDTFVTISFQNDERVLQKAAALFDAMLDAIKADGEDWLALNLFQPLPRVFADRGLEKGGNVLGLDRFKGDNVVYQVYLGWKDVANDAVFQTAAEKLIADVDAFAKSIKKDNPFIYLDYAYKTQKPLESYGEANLKKIRDVANKYDPEQVFQTLVPGGFKISNVGAEAGEGKGKGKGKGSEHNEL
ncbi:uncharacterized protein K452DRAFT_330009 [Aplosporella prunicola CBS 121167]|uniref:FAD-binding PCMH-type domain-containing protein n=1 Tax=Aplosporella prunicola CBS 121167 TaxID=1176127 RepID=A0A6A6AYH4_9PEZI|nr:uncharacterized protein K452DRAFT_330009 [Aplosporella prunicola CBS 121167]KAF2135827.1 hypothetical protein K452DRAFT_330009 [Aplosporella prunicola CBS 121167]